MEQDTNGHDVSAVPDGSGILVSCTCGWQVWSPTGAAPISLLLAEQKIGGEHLADVHVPAPARREARWAFGIFVLMVCVTGVMVYLIWTW